MERLQKFMARNGVASRRTCENIIARGRVRVNGKTVIEPGTTVDPGRDKVEVDGRVLGTAEEHVYLMLNKPRGYISSVSDPRGRKKVTDLLEDVRERVVPVGRLDYDSEGLLLMTNDGDLTYMLTHPSHGVPKTYRVRVSGVPGLRELDMLASGIILDDGKTAPAQVKFIEDREGNALLEITIKEGRNRQIRRMFEKVGHEVLRLKRVKIGDITLGELRPGKYRHLRENEVHRLKKMVAVGIRPSAKRG